MTMQQAAMRTLMRAENNNIKLDRSVFTREEHGKLLVQEAYVVIIFRRIIPDKTSSAVDLHAPFVWCNSAVNSVTD